MTRFSFKHFVGGESFFMGTVAHRLSASHRYSPSLTPECDRSHSDGHALLTRPSINKRRELIIPFDSDRRYHYWAGGQSVAATLRELHYTPRVRYGRAIPRHPMDRGSEQAEKVPDRRSHNPEAEAQRKKRDSLTARPSLLSAVFH